MRTLATAARGCAGVAQCAQQPDTEQVPMHRTPLEFAVAVWLVPVLPAQANWVQRATPVAPPARFAHGLAPGPGNTIVLFGGSVALPFGDTWILDGAGWRQMTTAVAPSARSSHRMAFDMFRGRVVLFGG